MREEYNSVLSTPTKVDKIGLVLDDIDETQILAHRYIGLSLL